MILGVRVECGPNSQVYDQVAQITRTLLPLMERMEIATVDEIGINNSLAACIRAEVVALDATVVSPSFVGAWACTGSPSKPQL